MSGYIGPIPVPQGIQNKETFTATAGQTTFNTNGYTDGAFISVYLNGVRLVNGTDYTSTNGSDVVLASGANAGDVLDFETFNSFSLASQQFENITTKNPTHEDTDGGRESAISFKGEQSGGEISTLAQIQASHDGTADDQKGDLIFKTNDGSDNDAPTERMRIDSVGNVKIGTTSDPSHGTADNLILAISGKQNNGSGVLAFLDTAGNSDALLTGDNGTLTINVDSSNATASSSLQIRVDNTERMRIDDSGNVGIGATTVDTKLHVENASGTTLVKTEVAAGSVVGYDIQKTGATTQHWRIADGISANGRLEIYDVTDSRCLAAFHGSGQVTLASNSTSSATDGFVVEAEGDTYITAEGVESRVLMLNRKSSDGDHIQFRKDNSEIGYIGTANSGDLYIGNEDTGFMFAGGSDAILPTNKTSLRDNIIDLGLSNYRFNDAYITNGVTTGSDERDKQQIASLTNAEITAAKNLSKLFKTYKWNDAVEEKGDNARTHTGVIAQQVETAMSDAGLDAGNYAFFISTTWWETETEVAAVEGIEAQDAVYDDDGNLVQERIKGRDAQDAYTRIDSYYTEDEAPEGATERNRKGIRYPELLAFIGAATEQRLTSIEARLDALEAE